MPILPIIDLLVFLGWTMISIGGVLKAVYITTSYRPTFLSLSPLDCLLVAAVFLLLSLTLAARTWVKANEAQGLAAQRAVSTLEAYDAAHAKARTENGVAGSSAAAEVGSVTAG
jgi:hypothetical protein